MVSMSKLKDKKRLPDMSLICINEYLVCGKPNQLRHRLRMVGR
jgi:hypothetical protein